MSFPQLHRFSLDNGLRVVLRPVRGVHAVGVSVHYDVGFRSEPEGRTGFAHLFEHLMSQGSGNVQGAEHGALVQAAGGSAGGSTHHDYTDYFQVVPSAALEQVLFLEADRMCGPRLTAESLRAQTEIVKEEIRTNVLNRPYGGFPWTVLPGILYRTYPNAHNGYGEFSDLERTTVEECERFFDRYYVPANAVLTVVGDIDVPAAEELVRRHFDDVPDGGRPVPVRLDEPRPVGTREGTCRDPHAAMPAVAVGHRLPDPRTELDAYLAHMVLATTLSRWESSRLKQRMIRQEGLAVAVSAGCGFFGPLEARAPDTFVTVVTHPSTVRTERILEMLDGTLADLGARGPTEDELARATGWLAATSLRRNDDLVVRTRALGAFELLHGRAELVDELPDRLRAVTPAQVAEAAAGLRPDSRAVLTLLTGSRTAHT
ncbi:M16 family metallopeptidase [Kitasatospora sp. NPDC101155]|uniref:M16 family metallopeptidase n=1 Tax=Kitasatospora sp. NPDC101155 TaxID=3364097 RepID=UPI0037FA57AE